MRHILFAAITMLIQFCVIYAISYVYQFSFMDTLFVLSFLILSATWLVMYFGTYSKNTRHLEDEQRGGSSFKAKIFRFKTNPFLTGIFACSILGILASFLYYAPYFM